MKLLIITQVVDSKDTFLSFFHSWIVELSKKYESIVVICLKKGEYVLPSNVKVLSLGKEGGESRIKYLIIFFKYIWREKKNYDKVFVHMNQEYVVLGGWLWKWWKKDVYMWRNHYAGSMWTDIAAYYCKKVFCTSRFSYTAKYKKTVMMPIGVDTGVFNPSLLNASKPNSILSLGRITPSKNINVLIDAFSILKKKGLAFSADIYGDALPQDIEYKNKLFEQVKNLDLGNEVHFYPGIIHSQTPEIYRSHQIFINPSKSGMYDKTIFEAMVSGCILLAANEDLKNHIDPDLIFDLNATSLADKIEMVMKYTDEKKKETLENLSVFAALNGLKYLAERLYIEMK